MCDKKTDNIMEKVQNLNTRTSLRSQGEIQTNITAFHRKRDVAEAGLPNVLKYQLFPSDLRFFSTDMNLNPKIKACTPSHLEYLNFES